MKFLSLSLLLFLAIYPASAEQFVEHGGRKILSFDVPELQFKGMREGKLTQMFFSNSVGEGNLKLTVRSKGWLSELKAEQRFEEDKRDKRRDQNTRLQNSIELPGSLKTLCYSISSPYLGQVVVVYTKDFRCELIVTGTGDADKMIDPTFQKLLSTLKIVPRTNISDIKIDE